MEYFVDLRICDSRSNRYGLILRICDSGMSPIVCGIEIFSIVHVLVKVFSAHWPQVEDNKRRGEWEAAP